MKLLIDADNLSFFYIFLPQIGVKLTKFNKMKQLRIFSALLMCLFALSFTACGDDDEGIGIGGADDSGNNNEEQYDYSLLDLKDYQEWEVGAITKGDTYILLRTDSLTKGYVGYISSNKSSGNGISIYFDEQLFVSKIYTEHGACYINKVNEEYASVHILTDEKSIFLDTVLINKVMHEDLSVSSRSINSNFLNNVAQGMSDFMDIQSWGEIAGNILQSNLEGLFSDIAREVATGILFKGNPVTSILTNLCFDNLKETQKKLDDEGVRLLLGNCNIKIDRIEKTGVTSYTLFLSVSNTSSIPPTKYGANRVVKAALALCEGPTVTYKNSSLRTVEFNVSSDITNIPVEVELPKKQTYYVAPYLLPFGMGNAPLHGYIRYGNTERLEYFNAYIKSKEQVSSEIIAGDKISCVSFVIAAIDDVKDIEEWGIYSPREGSLMQGDYDYYPMALNASYGDIRIEKNLPVSSFTKELTPNSLSFKKEIEIGVYKKYKLANGSIYITTDKLQSMELTHEISCTTGSATEVKEKEAIVACSYEGISKYTTFGVKISDKGEFTGEYNPLNNVYEFNLDNLKPNTTYAYCAYILIGGEYSYGEEKTFTTKGDGLSCPDGNHVHAVDLGLSVKWACCNVGATSPEEYGDHFAWGETSPNSTYTYKNCKTYGKNIGDISGNPAYDAATANWGDDWRMPTYDECQELVDKCPWQWTTQNGVKGCKVTSKKNGNSIFLPATGLRAGELLYEASDGEYWTDTTDPYDTTNQYACCLYFVSGGGNGVGGRQLRSYGNCIRPVKE